MVKSESVGLVSMEKENPPLPPVKPVKLSDIKPRLTQAISQVYFDNWCRETNKMIDALAKVHIAKARIWLIDHSPWWGDPELRSSLKRSSETSVRFSMGALREAIFRGKSASDAFRGREGLPPLDLMTPKQKQTQRLWMLQKRIARAEAVSKLIAQIARKGGMEEYSPEMARAMKTEFE